MTGEQIDPLPHCPPQTHHGMGVESNPGLGGERPASNRIYSGVHKAVLYSDRVCWKQTSVTVCQCCVHGVKDTWPINDISPNTSSHFWDYFSIFRDVLFESCRLAICPGLITPVVSLQRKPCRIQLLKIQQVTWQPFLAIQWKLRENFGRNGDQSACWHF